MSAPISRDGTFEASTSKSPFRNALHPPPQSPYLFAQPSHTSPPRTTSRQLHHQRQHTVLCPISSPSVKRKVAPSASPVNSTSTFWILSVSEKKQRMIQVPREFHSMVAGAGAGLVSSVVTCPLDVVKTTLQAQRIPRDSPGYEGVVKTVGRIWRQSGPKGFYRGLGPTLAGYLSTWAIYFQVYDLVKDRLRGWAENGSHPGTEVALMHVVAAMTAGATGTCLTNPLWVVKTRFMAQAVQDPSAARYRSTLDAILTIYRTEGFRAFYKGLLPSLVGVTHVAIQFPLYEKAKSWADRDRDGDHSTLPPSTILACSAFSKMVASLITYPHEVLRTRLQIRRSQPVPIPSTTPSASAPNPSTPSTQSKSQPSSMKPPPSSPSTKILPSAGPAGSGSNYARPAYQHHALPPSSFHPTHLYSPLITGSNPPIPPMDPADAQTNGNGNGKSKWYAKKGGIIHTLLKIKRQDGWRGLYRGLSINLVRTVPNSAVTMLTYELLMRQLA